VVPKEFVFQDLNLSLSTLRMMYPRIEGSAMHDVHPEGTRGTLETRVYQRNVNFTSSARRVVDDAPAVAAGYQGPTELLIWTADNLRARFVHLQVHTQMTSYQTRIDEDRAFEIDWPSDDHEWPTHIAQNLEEQMFVRPGDPVIQRLVNTWTNRRPRNARPYYLAKFLAGRVVEHVQPQGNSFHTDSRIPDLVTANRVSFVAPLLSGFQVNGSVHAAREGTGSPHDLACLLTAVYRAAGLPARMVIGYDVARSRRFKAPVIRAWTEFYLYDERIDRGEWIPVDIERQRAFSSVAPPIEQRWEYFGHNEEFHFVAPIAHHWFPPATVTVPGAPGFWGWVTEPADVIALQDLRFDAMETAMTIGPDGTRQRVPPQILR
jgi:hypothetical protein